MVCLGNICRSPLAEGILRSKLDPDLFEIDSAGTADYHVGDAPDPRAIKVAAEMGIDISGLRGRQFSVTDFDRFDYIYTMDLSNQENVNRLAENEHHRKKTGSFSIPFSRAKTLRFLTPITVPIAILNRYSNYLMRLAKK